MFDRYRASSYATAYPNIRTVANKYDSATVCYYLNGKKKSHEVINALYHPNKSGQLSVAFAEKIAA